MSTAVADVLRRARALVAKGWTQGAYARGKSGAALPAGYLSPRAVCWCADGALMLSLRRAPTHVVFAATAAMAAAIQPTTRHLISWNDEKGRTKRQVLAAFDRAIKAEERTP